MPLALDMSVTLSTSFVFSGYWMELTETVSMTTCALLCAMCEVSRSVHISCCMGLFIKVESKVTFTCRKTNVV